jgi:hypothetical protein
MGDPIFIEGICRYREVAGAGGRYCSESIFKS